MSSVYYDERTIHANNDERLWVNASSDRNITIAYQDEDASLWGENKGLELPPPPTLDEVTWLTERLQQAIHAINTTPEQN